MKKTKKSTSNLRKHKRLNADYLLKYETGTSNPAPRITNIKNISAGGMKFLTSEMLPESQTIRVNVLIPALEKSFSAQARVLRIRRLKRRYIYSVAVSFTDIESGEQETLNEFVESLVDNDMNPKFLVDHANVVIDV